MRLTHLLTRLRLGPSASFRRSWSPLGWDLVPDGIGDPVPHSGERSIPDPRCLSTQTQFIYLTFSQRWSV